jgi:hypothetical protein
MTTIHASSRFNPVNFGCFCAGGKSMGWREALLQGLTRFEKPLKAFGKLASARLLISALSLYVALLSLAGGASECPVIEGDADEALRAPHARV